MHPVGLFVYIALPIVLFLFCIQCKSFENSPQRFFYIYDWPEYMSDVWPPENSPLHSESPYEHAFRSNDGAGKCILPDIGNS